MTTIAFIIGMAILGVCIVVASLILSGAITGAAASAKESAPQAMQQPTLSFLTEYDAADYIGVSLNELDYIRSEGLLDGSFVAVTSLEQTGEEEYKDIVDGMEVYKTRPVMSNVTRFLFNRQLLDEKVCDMIKNGKHVNPMRGQNKSGKKSGGAAVTDISEGKAEKNKNSAPEKAPENKEKSNKPEQKNNNNGNQNKNNGPKPNNNNGGNKQQGNKQNGGSRPNNGGNNGNNDRPNNNNNGNNNKNSNSVQKPVGPAKPHGPIGGDDEEEDFIDIMTKLSQS